MQLLRLPRRRGLLAAAAVSAVLLAAPAAATPYGAHDVRGSIEQRYLATGGPTGFLGLPLTDETATADRAGRFNRFEGGSIYWSPATPAVEVHGAIRVRWEQLAAEAGPLGYPVSDEDTTPDGTGRVNHFQRGKIYFTPSTGAHEIYGAILARWVQLGYETSPLGYPTSGEYAVPGGRRNDFQGGSITWTPRGGAVVQLAGQAPGRTVLSGSGTDVVQVAKPAGPMLARIRTTGDTGSNFIVQSYFGTEEGDVLVNDIGRSDAVVPLDWKEFDDTSPQTTAFAVESDTTWEIELIPLSATGTFGKGTTIGESRSTVWRYVGAAGKARLTNNAQTGNFIVLSYDSSTALTDVLVNEIGAFDGFVPVRGNSYLEITSDGPWAITVV